MIHRSRWTCQHRTRDLRAADTPRPPQAAHRHSRSRARRRRSCGSTAATSARATRPTSSPVTLADEAAQAVILHGLAAALARRAGRLGGSGPRRESHRRRRSCWSIRSTARASSSPGATNTPSISRWCATASRSSASSRRRHWACSGAAARAAPSGCTVAGRDAVRAGDDPHPPVAERARRGGQPLAFRRGKCRVPAALRADNGTRLRLGAEILPRRRRRGRPLSAARADLRMGRGGRPRGGGGGGRTW